MRKKGVISLVIFIALIVALTFIFTDSWLEHTMESAGSSIVGAKVEFDGVDFSLLHLRMRWQRLQVTDPKDTWKNLFETGKTEFALELEPLLTKKIIIDNLQLEGLRFSTKRETDGKLPEKPSKPEEKSKVVLAVQNELEKATAKMPVMNLQQYSRKVNVDSLWKMIDLRSPQKIDSLKKEYEQKYANWENRLQTLPTEKELKGLQSQIEGIQVDQIKTVNDFQTALAKANRIYKEADSLNKNFKKIKSDFQTQIAQIKTSPDVVKQWINQDYQRALQLAHLPEISVKNVADILFGRQIINKVQAVSGYVGTARYYMEKVKSTQPKKKESPPRLKGQDIYFSSKRNWPKFWIKQISLSGVAMNEVQLAGNVKDVVSSQAVIGKPTTFAVNGTRRDQAALKVDGTFDYLGEKPTETINVNFQNMPMSNIKLSDSPILPYKFQQGSGRVNSMLQFQGSDFLADVKFVASGVRFDYSDKPVGLNPRLVEITRSIAEAINTINVQAVAKRTGDKFSFSINSNLDNLIYNKMKEIVSGEVEKARQQLEQRVRAEVEKYQKNLEALTAQKKQELQSRLDLAQAEIQKRTDEIQAKRKEIEDRIEQEKKKLQKNLENQAKDKLKDLFKK